MKLALILTVTIAAAASLSAQEPQPLSAEELGKATKALIEVNAQLTDLPLKLELAPEQAVGFKAGEAGALLIPDKRLAIAKADREARKLAKTETQPAGQLWLLKLVPKDKATALPSDKLRLVKVGSNDRERELTMFTLGIVSVGKKEFALALYGKGSQPLLQVPLTASEKRKGKDTGTTTLTARKTGEESGVLEVNLFGRFKAEIPVGTSGN